LDGVRRLKAGDGPDLVVWGSTTLTSVLFGQGLVDEVALVDYPVLRGRGKRFYPDNADPSALALVGTVSTPTGVLFNTYRCVGSQ
jgi:dihydrofolate reductase